MTTYRDWAESDFVRIYHSIKDDEKLGPVYDDDRLFAWYVRLLLEAHALYPTSPFIPRTLPRRILNDLAERGVIIVNRDRYTVSGLVKEKAEVVGRSGGIVRAATAEREGGRFVAGTRMPSVEIADGRADIEAFVEVRRRAPTDGQRRVLDDILSRHDVTGPAWAAQLILSNPSDPIGAVIEADKAWREEQKTRAIHEEQKSAERNRRKPGLRDPLQQEIARAMVERYPEEVSA